MVRNIKIDGSWTHLGVFENKICGVCGSSFKPKSGSHKFCCESCKGRWKYLSGEMTTESQYKYISGNWERYFCRLCNRSQKRVSLTVEDLLGILKTQNYKCALSGIALTCKLEKGIKNKTNASIDRIEAGGPYIKENVQLVCSALNRFRCDTDQQEFIWWCKKVAEYDRET